MHAPLHQKFADAAVLLRTLELHQHRSLPVNYCHLILQFRRKAKVTDCIAVSVLNRRRRRPCCSRRSSLSRWDGNWNRLPAADCYYRGNIYSDTARYVPIVLELDMHFMRCFSGILQLVCGVFAHMLVLWKRTFWKWFDLFVKQYRHFFIGHLFAIWRLEITWSNFNLSFTKRLDK